MKSSFSIDVKEICVSDLQESKKLSPIEVADDESNNFANDMQIKKALFPTEVTDSGIDISVSSELKEKESSSIEEKDGIAE